MPQASIRSRDSVSSGLVLPAVPARVSSAASSVRAATIPAALGSYELRLPRPPVDQKQVNCCVSCALGAAMEIINPAAPSLAPMFHYHVARFLRAGGSADGSLDLPIAFAALSNEGICRTDLHPVEFDEASAAKRPSPSAFGDGKARALVRRGLLPRYQQATTASRSIWAREQLRLGRPVVIGFPLPLNYEQQYKNRNFIWRDPEDFELSTSGHCVLATGFNDAKQALHIRDSRGDEKFDKGYWWLGYRVADSRTVNSMFSLIP